MSNFTCIDERTDTTSSVRLASFLRFCYGDEISEDIVALLTLLERATRTKICKAVLDEFFMHKLPF